MKRWSASEHIIPFGIYSGSVCDWLVHGDSQRVPDSVVHALCSEHQWRPLVIYTDTLMSLHQHDAEALSSKRRLHVIQTPYERNEFPCNWRTLFFPRETSTVSKIPQCDEVVVDFNGASRCIEIENEIEAEWYYVLADSDEDEVQYVNALDFLRSEEGQNWQFTSFEDHQLTSLEIKRMLLT